MGAGEIYIVKHEAGISIMHILFETSNCYKVRWKNGIEEWIYKSDFKSTHSYIDPKKIIVQKVVL